MDVKERILEKACDLFMRYGIRAITMDEIASQLGISKKTIYHFFTDKDEIVEAVAEQEVHSSQLECERWQGISENAVHEIFLAIEQMEEILKAMNPLIMYDLEKHYPKAYKKFRDHKYRFMYQMIKENLERGIKEELYRPEINIDIIAKHRIESAFMGFNQDIFPHNKYKISDVGNELGIFFLHGITTLKGKKMIEKYLQERLKNKPRLYE
jgi:AcrR family transcriptional regulator